MTNSALAEELRNWAQARHHLNRRRVEEGKALLNSDVLIEAANRLEQMDGIVTGELSRQVETISADFLRAIETEWLHARGRLVALIVRKA